MGRIALELICVESLAACTWLGAVLIMREPVALSPKFSMRVARDVPVAFRITRRSSLFLPPLVVLGSGSGLCSDSCGAVPQEYDVSVQVLGYFGRLGLVTGFVVWCVVAGEPRCHLHFEV